MGLIFDVIWEIVTFVRSNELQLWKFLRQTGPPVDREGLPIVCPPAHHKELKWTVGFLL